MLHGLPADVRWGRSGMLRCGSSSSAAACTMRRRCGSGWRNSRPCRARRASSSRAAGRSPTPCGACSRPSACDDLAAHRMAILAMQQFGLALQAMEPRLALAETEAELRAARGCGLAALAAGRARARDRGELGGHVRQPGLLARDPPGRQRSRAGEIRRVGAIAADVRRLGCKPAWSIQPSPASRPVRWADRAGPSRPAAVLRGIARRSKAVLFRGPRGTWGCRRANFQAAVSFRQP